MADEKQPAAVTEQAKPLDDAARAARIEALKGEIEALKPRPKTAAEMSDTELGMAWYKAVTELLGSHPRLDAIYQEMVTRAKPKEEAPEAK